MAKVKSTPEILIVFNPQASAARKDLLTRLVKQRFSERQVKMLELNDKKSAKETVRPYIEAGVHLLVVAGGDGTISNIAPALINTNVPLGILPLGTGNILARELAIPVNPDKAAQLLAGKFQVRRIDAIEMEGRVFLLGVSVGLSAHTMRRTRTKDKKRFGRMAYIWAFILSLFGIPQQNFQLEIDGQQLPIRANEVIAVNAGAIGYKALRWGPSISPDDGYLDVCFIRARTLFHYLQVFSSIILGKRYAGDRLQCVKAKKQIIFKSPASLLMQGDGDIIGHTPATLKLLASALKVAVP